MSSRDPLRVDPYESLNVPKVATGDVVRKAYGRIAREHHPDANPDDPAAEERFKEIQQAYELLTDPGKRRAYDENWSSRPSPRRKRAGAPRTTAGGRVGQTTGSVNLSDLIAKRVNGSGLRTGGRGKSSGISTVRTWPASPGSWAWTWPASRSLRARAFR